MVMSDDSCNINWPARRAIMQESLDQECKQSLVDAVRLAEEAHGSRTTSGIVTARELHEGNVSQMATLVDSDRDLYRILNNVKGDKFLCSKHLWR